MNNLLENVLEPALRILPPMMTSDRARALLLVIQLQEDPDRTRRQIAGYRKDGTVISGPARGLWQFERAGIRGVLHHPRTAEHAANVCWRCSNAGTTAAVYHQLESDDILACAFARLLLWTLPGALPGRDQAEEGWRQYVAAWRPGRPHRERWDANFEAAWDAVLGTVRA